MEWLQTLLDSSTTPVLTAFLLGLLTAISPCPLATNIAAIGYIGKDIEDRRRVFLNGLLYTAGRIVAYTVLGLVLILIIRQGASMFGIQKFIGTWGELLLGPALIVIGLLMLFSHRLNLPQFGFNGSNAEGLKKHGGWGAFFLGVLFAMAFCPTSGMFYFGRYVLLRNAHSHVSNSHVGLPAASGLCLCHRLARACCRLAVGFQHAEGRQILRLAERH